MEEDKRNTDAHKEPISGRHFKRPFDHYEDHLQNHQEVDHRCDYCLQDFREKKKLRRYNEEEGTSASLRNQSPSQGEGESEGIDSAFRTIEDHSEVEEQQELTHSESFDCDENNDVETTNTSQGELMENVVAGPSMVSTREEELHSEVEEQQELTHSESFDCDENNDVETTNTSQGELMENVVAGPSVVSMREEELHSEVEEHQELTLLESSDCDENNTSRMHSTSVIEVETTNTSQGELMENVVAGPSVVSIHEEEPNEEELNRRHREFFGESLLNAVNGFEDIEVEELEMVNHDENNASGMHSASVLDVEANISQGELMENGVVGPSVVSIREEEPNEEELNRRHREFFGEALLNAVNGFEDIEVEELEMVNHDENNASINAVNGIQAENLFEDIEVEEFLEMVDDEGNDEE